MLPTLKQRRSVFFIQHTLDINFTGDIRDINDIRQFLGKFLKLAKDKANCNTKNCNTKNCKLHSLDINSSILK